MKTVFILPAPAHDFQICHGDHFSRTCAESTLPGNREPFAVLPDGPGFLNRSP
nr:MAG TPA: hypothetical protein [Caudoviricetes sp.]